MTESNHRIKRPRGFKTMAILGYITQGFTFIIYPFFIAFEISEGQIFVAGISLIWLLLAPAVIVAIFMMIERKSNTALNLIRIYLWGNIPLSLVGGIADVADLVEPIESIDSIEVGSSVIATILGIVVAVPIALYWQQKSHSDYLKSFNH